GLHADSLMARARASCFGRAALCSDGPDDLTLTSGGRRRTRSRGPAAGDGGFARRHPRIGGRVLIRARGRELRSVLAMALAVSCLVGCRNELLAPRACEYL